MAYRLSRTVAVLCAIVCSFAGSLPWLLVDRLSMRSSRDGLVWDRYERGELVERQVDTNGDGRADVAEYYAHGALLRRASDRNFNGVTDLVEYFDADTHEPTRSIVDEDYDGSADLLVLFRDGAAVATERPSARQRRDATSVGGSASARLASLRNPFGATAAFEPPFHALPHETWFGSGGTDGLVVSATAIPDSLCFTASLPPVHWPTCATALSFRSPRGPPQA